jgi:hypothetical protein
MVGETGLDPISVGQNTMLQFLANLIFGGKPRSDIVRRRCLFRITHLALASFWAGRFTIRL